MKQLVLCGVACLLPAVAVAQQGNVLIVVADDLGIDQLASYGVGSNLPSTPTLDSLAAQGVVFLNAWANPVCSPTRSAIQTGRHAFRTGIGSPVSGDSALALSEVTIPEMLDATTGGLYGTALIGKWHLGNGNVGGALNPNLQGYDHFAGPLGNIPGTESYYGYTKVVDGAVSTSTTYATTDQVDDTLAWIASTPAPWFCVLSFSAPHYPLEAPPAGLSSIDLTGLSAHADPKPFYNAMVEAMDAELGRLLTQMNPLTLAQTTVLFIGDNGTASGGVVAPFDPLKAKYSVFEGGVHVPLIASGHGVTAPGRNEKALVHAVDFFATVAEIAGVDPTAALPPGTALDSVSLLPYLKNTPNPAKRKFMFVDTFAPNGPATATQTAYAMREKRYKLIEDSSAPGDQYYDLVADPFETTNLLDSTLTSPQFAIYRRLKAQLGALLSTK